jgi:hypothetical protein
MVITHQAASHRNREERQAGSFDELLKEISGTGPPHAAARDHYRPFSGSQHLRRIPDLRFTGNTIGNRRDGRVPRSAAVRLERVQWDRQMYSTLPAIGRLGECPPQIEGNLLCGSHFRSPFHNRLRHPDLIEVLEGLPSSENTRTASADQHERATRQMGGSKSGERIRVSRSSRYQCDGRPPRDSRVRVRCVGDTRFVAHVDNLHAGTRQRSKSLIQVISDKSEHAIHSQVD